MPTTEYQLTPQQISGLAGLALALILQFIPGLKTYWDTIDSLNKRLLLLLFCVVAAWAIAIAGCGGDSVCSLAKGHSVFENALLAWGSNQVVYAAMREILKRLGNVKTLSGA